MLSSPWEQEANLILSRRGSYTSEQYKYNTESALPIMRQNNTKEAVSNTNINANMKTYTKIQYCMPPITIKQLKRYSCYTEKYTFFRFADSMNWI